MLHKVAEPLTSRRGITAARHSQSGSFPFGSTSIQNETAIQSLFRRPQVQERSAFQIDYHIDLNTSWQASQGPVQSMEFGGTGLIGLLN